MRLSTWGQGLGSLNADQSQACVQSHSLGLTTHLATCLQARPKAFPCTHAGCAGATCAPDLQARLKMSHLCRICGSMRTCVQALPHFAKVLFRLCPRTAGTDTIQDHDPAMCTCTHVTQPSKGRDQTVSKESWNQTHPKPRHNNVHLSRICRSCMRRWRSRWLTL